MKKQGLKILELHLKHVENAVKANPDKYTYMVEALKQIKEGIEKRTGLSKFFHNWKIKFRYQGFFQKK